MQTTTLLRKTLRDVRGATIGIAILTAAMALVDLLLYPSYRDSLQDFQIPEAMQGFLGEANDISSPEGFITAEFFSWIPLVLTILAVVGGTAAFAGEEGAGTMDLLLSQPVKRWHVALAKASGLTVAITCAALSGLLGFAVGKMFVEFDMSIGRLAVAVLSMLPVTLVFLGLSLWSSARFPNRGSAAMLVTGLVVISYFIQILGDAAPALETIRKASLFYWSEPSRVLLNGFDWVRSGVLLVLAIVAVGLAVRNFERRDVAAGAREWHFRELRSISSFGRFAHQAPSLSRIDSPADDRPV